MMYLLHVVGPSRWVVEASGFPGAVAKRRQMQRPDLESGGACKPDCDLDVRIAKYTPATLLCTSSPVFELQGFVAVPCRARKAHSGQSCHCCWWQHDRGRQASSGALLVAQVPAVWWNEHFSTFGLCVMSLTSAHIFTWLSRAVQTNKVHTADNRLVDCYLCRGNCTAEHSLAGFCGVACQDCTANRRLQLASERS